MMGTVADVCVLLGSYYLLSICGFFMASLISLNLLGFYIVNASGGSFLINLLLYVCILQAGRCYTR